jgi:hypothetical protein
MTKKDVGWSLKTRKEKKLRDKKRIIRIIELIGQLWDKFPDMRFTQLCENYLDMSWFVEDDHTEQQLVKVIEFYNKQEKKNEKFKKAGKVKSRNHKT